jgi:DNA-binding transcriptional regulator YiaG
MSNLNKVLQEEIRRIARKEASQLITPLKKNTITLKKSFSLQKQKITELEKAIKQSLPRKPKVDANQESCELHITGKQIRSLRSRLGVSQGQLSRLIDASPQIIAVWENKPGRLRIRKESVRKALVELKGMKKAEVQERIG